MPRLLHPRPMKDFDPARPARLHDQLNDALYDWPGSADTAQWTGRATRHDGAGTVVNFDGLLFDGWEPKP
jgi:hypothetical protein